MKKFTGPTFFSINEKTTNVGAIVTMSVPTLLAYLPPAEQEISQQLAHLLTNKLYDLTPDDHCTYFSPVKLGAVTIYDEVHFKAEVETITTDKQLRYSTPHLLEERVDLYSLLTETIIKKLEDVINNMAKTDVVEITTKEEPDTRAACDPLPLWELIDQARYNRCATSTYILQLKHGLLLRVCSRYEGSVSETITVLPNTSKQDFNL